MSACLLQHWMDTIQHRAHCRAAVARPGLWIAASWPEGKTVMPASQLALLGGHISGVVAMHAAYFPAGCDAVPGFAFQIMQAETGEVLTCDSHISHVFCD